MHELSLVESLLEECSTRAGGRQVAGLRVRCHEGIDAEEISECFGFLTSSEPQRWGRLCGATIEVERVPARMKCACGRDGVLGSQDVAGHIGICPSCGHAGELGNGLELVGIAYSGKEIPTEAL
ncbi:MAG TPA: hydrogenase/urease maturation nickel metallochaperone HypA [Acidimicrobiales bacterium]|nr:hydrogenase/urease maturation nickel metallochaperone HypA [Acidimicrobiales bacterium]